MMKSNLAANRRGAILLVVLGLLTMFTMMGLAFVLIAGQAKRSSRVVQRIDQQSLPPEKILHEAFLQAVRGTNNPASVLGSNSFLEDIYGNDTLFEDASNNPLQIQNKTSLASGQLFSFTNPDTSKIRTGCVLTMLTGPCAGESTHIVGANADFTTYHAVRFPSGLPNDDDIYVINGVPFSGTGFGWDTANNNLRKTDTVSTVSAQVALLPRHADNRNPSGGANEDYDAPDYQNMLLGAIIPQPDGSLRIMPSLHRPDLVAYWAAQSGVDFTNATYADLLRSVMLRPNQHDHPDFWNGVNPPGSNRGFDATIFGRPSGQPSPFDVDNDGDGVTDSVWVDIGLPVMSRPDGTLYKPLVAYLCLDRDGCLNVNAQGSLDQTVAAYEGNVSAANDVPPPASWTGLWAGSSGNLLFADTGNGTATITAPVRRGLGYGPAEINLRALFQGIATTPTPLAMYEDLLSGDGTNWDGRYGEWLYSTRKPSAGYTNTNTVGIGDDWLSYNSAFEYSPGEYPDTLAPTDGGGWWNFLLDSSNYTRDSFGAPPDMRGTGVVGLDLGGRPLWSGLASTFDPAETTQYRMGMGGKNQHIDDPYEIDLSLGAPRGLYLPESMVPDNPFGPSELERVLRPFDRDAPALPRRLFALTYDSTLQDSVLARRRLMVTTESWDLPVPSISLPPDLFADFRTAHPGERPAHVTDLLRAKSVAATLWRDLFPSEMLAGLQLNLNRPFGDGRDDNGNGVVDDDAEEANETFSQWTKPGTKTGGIAFDHHNGLTTTQTARQMQARWLYVLMMLMADHDYLDAQTGSSDATCRLIAQWAVNVVDFRDRDSTMTRFVFDTDPFDGWSTTESDLTDGRNVVYGCERPELLITEAIAFHDRRTEDLDTEQPDPATDQAATTTDTSNPDPDFDQRRRPLASLFVELHNPNSPLELPSADLYESAPTGRPPGVALNRKTSGGSPVWRMIVVGPETGVEEQPDPDDPLSTNRPPILRSVYFVDIESATAPTDDANRYYPSAALASSVAPVMPGRYAVVGPGGTASGSSYPTYLGVRTGQTIPDNQTRRIVLTPNSNPNQVDQVQIRDNKIVGDYDKPDGNGPIQPPVAVVVNRYTDGTNTADRRLSISEPVAGYPVNDADPSNPQPYNQANDEYTKPYDIPFDTDNTRQPEDDIRTALSQNGTTAGIRVIHLQRLANPLLDFNATTNPYVTIDSAPVDLTAFNGLTSDTEPGVSSADTMLVGRERGEQNDDAESQNIWKQEPVVKTVAAPGGSAITNHVFAEPLVHTLGWLNKAFGQPIAAAAAGQPQYRGLPVLDATRQPFPWLTWLNRPFVSKHELLLVPTLRSSKLLVRNTTNPRQYYSYVKAGATPDQYAGNPWTALAELPYPHLMNFFQSDASAPDNAPEFHRFLEYVGVPSPFVGTTLQGNPSTMVGGSHSFRPPFHHIPTYREPGKINLNTIFYPEVFRGLMNDPQNLMGADTLWEELVHSRRGFMPTSGAHDEVLPTPETAYPSVFGKPFRSFSGATLVPLAALEEYPLDAPHTKREIDSTILRSNPEAAASHRPLFDSTNTTPAQNTDRNPFFRYREIERLANLTTTRSNVYAIWITVGYFEVTPTAPTAVHPDGYRLGRELGSDTGEIERHRAFYIFDRSIPVGFRRGEDLNVENGILVRRYIE